jgi:hypothetical protein
MIAHPFLLEKDRLANYFKLIGHRKFNTSKQHGADPNAVMTGSREKDHGRPLEQSQPELHGQRV